MSNEIEPKYPDAESIRKEYMAWDGFEWYGYAKSKGWEPLDSRLHYPAHKWREEKMRLAGEERAEKIAIKMHDFKYGWHDDVLDTVKQYPSTAHSLHHLIRLKIRDIMIQVPSEEAVYDEKQKKDVPVMKAGHVSSTELNRLASALEHVTEVRLKALNITNWKPEKAQQAAEVEREEEGQSAGWKIHIKGMGDVELDDLRKMQEKWIDKPQE